MSKFTAGYSWLLNFILLKWYSYLFVQIYTNGLNPVAQNNEGGKNNVIVHCCLWHSAAEILVSDYNSLRTRKISGSH